MNGNTVVYARYSFGYYAVERRSLPEITWEMPAAWKGVVKGGQVTYWQVYADNQPRSRDADYRERVQGPCGLYPDPIMDRQVSKSNMSYARMAPSRLPRRRTLSVFWGGG